MTPLATSFANDLMVPIKKRRTRDDAGLLNLIRSGDLHCFEVSAIGGHIHQALEAENLWPDVESMVPLMFLPSPVTWLEYEIPEQGRVAWVLESTGDAFRLSFVTRQELGLFSIPLCDFRARSVLERGDRIKVTDLCTPAYSNIVGQEEKTDLRSSVGELAEAGLPLERRVPLLEGRLGALEAERAELDGLIKRMERVTDDGDFSIDRTAKLGISFSTLALDLINTPGLIGLRQHDPHRGLARKLGAVRSGSYPLRGWSEIVLKHQTRIADPAEQNTGPAFHKCLHFVRSHERHYRDGCVTIIPAHWRGDPALGIKRTRYRVDA